MNEAQIKAIITSIILAKILPVRKNEGSPNYQKIYDDYVIPSCTVADMVY